MSEQDQASKTEEPTERRIKESRDRGEVASSQDIRTWAILLGTGVFVALLAPVLGRGLMPVLASFLETSGTAPLDGASAMSATAALLGRVGWLLAPAMVLLVVLGLAAGIGQVGMIWAPTKVKPDLKRLSLIKGLGRLFSLSAVMEFAKGLFKLAAVAAVGLLVAVPLASDVALMPSWPIMDGLDRLHRIATAMTLATVAVMAAIALVDYAYQRHKFLRDLRMTRQEVRDEYRQSEGDPHVKARIKRLRSERARVRMMAAVPTADVVVTNPTHFAVALAYDTATMGAPKVVAKGVDAVALRIREVAEEAGVPVMENPPLARSLHASVDLDHEVPTEHYQAVAEVIAFVMRRRNGAQ